MKSRGCMWIFVIVLSTALSMPCTVAAQEQPVINDAGLATKVTGSIWVVNAGSNTVTKLRASDGALLATYSVGSGPVSAAFDGSSIWVVNDNDNTVTKLRASNGQWLGTFPVGTTPSGAAFGGGYIWVANQGGNGGNTVTKLRPSDGATIATFGLPRTQDQYDSPRGLVFDGSSLWVTVTGVSRTCRAGCFVFTPNLVRIRATDGKNLGVLRLGSSNAGNVALGSVAFDGANVWAAYTSNGYGYAERVRVSDGHVLGSTRGGKDAEGIVYAGTSMWMADFVDNAVAKFRTSDGIKQRTFTSGLSGPYVVAFDGSAVWVINYSANTVTKLRVTDGALLGTFPVGKNPHAIIFASAQ